MRFSNGTDAFANNNINMTAAIDWILFDVYKIASHFPLEVSVFAFVFGSTEVSALEFENSWSWAQRRVNVTAKFQSKSTRDDLQGLKLKCGLVVSFI